MKTRVYDSVYGRLRKKPLAALRIIADGYGIHYTSKTTRNRLAMSITTEMAREPTRQLKKSKKLVNRWYVYRVQTGKERRVRRDVKRKAKILFLDKLVGKILIPRYKSVELLKGERKVFRRKHFPGYLICNVAYCPETFHLFDRQAYGMGFVPFHTSPEPLTDDEVDAIMKADAESKEKNEPVKIGLKLGDKVKIVEGMFSGDGGTVTSVIDDGSPEPKVKVTVMILGRPVEVTLRHWQVSPA